MIKMLEVDIKDKAKELWTDEVKTALKTAWATFKAEQEAKIAEEQK